MKATAEFESGSPPFRKSAIFVIWRKSSSPIRQCLPHWQAVSCRDLKAPIILQSGGESWPFCLRVTWLHVTWLRLSPALPLLPLAVSSVLSPLWLSLFNPNVFSSLERLLSILYCVLFCRSFSSTLYLSSYYYSIKPSGFFFVFVSWVTQTGTKETRWREVGCGEPERSSRFKNRLPRLERIRMFRSFLLGDN